MPEWTFIQKRSMKITDHSVVTRTDNCSEAITNDKIVVFGMHAGAYFSFKDTAACVWRMLESPQRVSDLITLLSGRFHGEPNVISQDLIKFLCALQKERLIAIVSDDYTH